MGCAHKQRWHRSSGWSAAGPTLGRQMLSIDNAVGYTRPQAIDGVQKTPAAPPLVSRHRSSVGLRWPSKRIAALHRLPIRSVLARDAPCAELRWPRAAYALASVTRHEPVGSGIGPCISAKRRCIRWFHGSVLNRPFSIVRSQPRNFPPLQAWCSAQAQHGIGTTADDPLGALPRAANWGVGSAIGFPGWTGRPGKSLFGSVNHRTHLLIANVPGGDKHPRAVQRDAALDIALGLARDRIDGIKRRAVV